MKQKYYTIYDKKTERIVAFGDSDECTKQLGLKNREQFYAHVSKTRSGYLKRHEIITEPLDESILEPEEE